MVHVKLKHYCISSCLGECYTSCHQPRRDRLVAITKQGARHGEEARSPPDWHQHLTDPPIAATKPRRGPCGAGSKGTHDPTCLPSYIQQPDGGSRQLWEKVLRGDQQGTVLRNISTRPADKLSSFPHALEFPGCTGRTLKPAGGWAGRKDELAHLGAPGNLQDMRQTVPTGRWTRSVRWCSQDQRRLTLAPRRKHHSSRTSLLEKEAPVNSVIHPQLSLQPKTHGPLLPWQWNLKRQPTE